MVKSKRTDSRDGESVRLGIDSDTLLDILKVAASRERTVVEFQTHEVDGQRELDFAMDITEHVEQLENEQI